ncbi:hypothetical protein [Desulfosoma caldarium]|uniref:hypothetical protein n=1 Tax=Desulfosoma caldarium TaxID=610254 RepID=UPI0011CD9AA1|nr:hypothetical protein [Desulfosoma caldarium]
MEDIVQSGAFLTAEKGSAGPKVLLKQGKTLQERMVFQSAFAVFGQEDDREIGSNPPHGFRLLTTGEFGHGEVCDEQIRAVGVFSMHFKASSGSEEKTL